MATETAEHIFFEHGGVKVTNARFLVDGQTFAMSNVTSIKTREKKPNRLWPMIFILAGITGLFTEPLGGVLVLGIALAWLWKQQTLYFLILRTASSETNALTTNQRSYLDQVTTALNAAIVHRE
jgi:Family of unknown function (DUF6232)